MQRETFTPEESAMLRSICASDPRNSRTNDVNARAASR
jgi:hypothetical protein